MIQLRGMHTYIVWHSHVIPTGTGDNISDTELMPMSLNDLPTVFPRTYSISWAIICGAEGIIDDITSIYGPRSR